MQKQDMCETGSRYDLIACAFSLIFVHDNTKSHMNQSQTL